MMGRLDDRQQPLFYDFCLEDHVPDDHLLRQIAKVLDLSDVRHKLAPYYSVMGRPSLDPELMIRMLLVGYLYGIRSERRLVEEVHLNLAYRWFCGLGLKGEVPERSSFSKTRHGRFRDSDAFRLSFESVLQACLRAGLVSGETFATRKWRRLSIHSIEQRSAKWIISTMERTGDHVLPLTQEQLARMLGVGRSYTSRVIQTFKSEGILETRRGSIVVHNSAALEARSCLCNESVKRHFDEVLRCVYPNDGA